MAVILVISSEAFAAERNASKAAKNASSLSLPSANCSAASTAFRLRSSGIKCHILRQHPTANNRNFRSLALPRRNSNIGVGLAHASHSASVMAFPLHPRHRIALGSTRPHLDILPLLLQSLRQFLDAESLRGVSSARLAYSSLGVWRTRRPRFRGRSKYTISSKSRSSSAMVSGGLPPRAIATNRSASR